MQITRRARRTVARLSALVLVFDAFALVTGTITGLGVALALLSASAATFSLLAYVATTRRAARSSHRP